MPETAPAPFRDPMINIYSHDVMRLVRFYEGLGFHETFRTCGPTSAAGPSRSCCSPTTPTASTPA